MNICKTPGRALEQPEKKRRPLKLTWGRAAREDSLRDTGIHLIGQIPWGSHLCLFYESKQDLVDAALDYFRPAPRANEFCAWFIWEPLSEHDAREALRSNPALESLRNRGGFDIVRAENWHLKNDRFDMQAAIAELRERVANAMARGFDGLRICANPSWRKVSVWNDINAYERALDAMIAKQRMIVLCAYKMGKSPSADVLNVANTHQCIIARRRRAWEFLEIPNTADVRHEIDVLNDDLGVLPARLRAGGPLTERERVVLAQIVKGATSKSASRTLGISPRTVEYHRANIMQKLGAKNAADLVQKVLRGRRSGLS